MSLETAISHALQTSYSLLKYFSVVIVVYFHRVVDDLGDPNSTLMGPHDSCTQVGIFAPVGRLIVQSLNSPFVLPHIGAEPGRAKRESARVQPLYEAGRKESSGTGLVA